MPFVTIKMVEGRTIAQKRTMAKDVTHAIVKNIGCPPAAVHIDIIEYSRENIADAGTLMCDQKR